MPRVKKGGSHEVETPIRSQTVQINVPCIHSPRSFVEASHIEEWFANSITKSIRAKNRVKDRLRNRVKERFFRVKDRFRERFLTGRESTR